MKVSKLELFDGMENDVIHWNPLIMIVLHVLIQEQYVFSSVLIITALLPFFVSLKNVRSISAAISDAQAPTVKRNQFPSQTTPNLVISLYRISNDRLLYHTSRCVKTKSALWNASGISCNNDHTQPAKLIITSLNNSQKSSRGVREAPSISIIEERKYFQARPFRDTRLRCRCYV